MSISRRQDEGPASQAEPATILIVDDEKFIRVLCANALTGYRLLQAGNCADAMRLFADARTAVELILTDVMMPGGTGLDLLRQVKQLDPNAAVIIMTSLSEKEVILNALKAGADDFINKPLNPLQLRTAVERALGRKRLKEELANLKQMDRLKSNFLSLISHKLRTPITTISLFLQNLQQGVYDCGDTLFLKNAQLINDEAAYLGRLVTDLLTFSQVMEGSAGLQLESCDLNQIVAGVLQNSREAQGKEGIETEFHESPLPVMRLDRTKITFALQQIVDNAYKFSCGPGKVSATLRRDADEACIVVSDAGIGIPREEIARVFEKFHQIDPDNSGQVRGFGLGLFYAREFVRQHGGGIGMESEAGQGTTVTVTLPL